MNVYMDDNQTSSCCHVTSVTEHLQCTSEVPQKYAASTLVPSNPQLKVSPSTEETQELSMDKQSHIGKGITLLVPKNNWN